MIQNGVIGHGYYFSISLKWKGTQDNIMRQIRHLSWQWWPKALIIMRGPWIMFISNFRVSIFKYWDPRVADGAVTQCQHIWQVTSEGVSNVSSAHLQFSHERKVKHFIICAYQEFVMLSLCKCARNNQHVVKSRRNHNDCFHMTRLS